MGDGEGVIQETDITADHRKGYSYYPEYPKKPHPNFPVKQNMHRAMKTCGGTHLSSICLPHFHQVVIQSRFCLSPCSCSHSYPLFTSLYLSLFCVSRPQSSSQKSSQRSHGNQSPLFGSAERVHECLTNIPPQKCHLSASERGGDND